MKRIKKRRIYLLLFISFLASIIVYSVHTQGPKRPNVILITIDALRSDHLSCYGYRRNTSPNIDKLAKEGVMFEQAISASSSTIASVPSIMTATYPHVHAVRNFGDLLNSSVISLAKILKDNGFYTGMLVAQFFPHFRIRRDFVSERIKLNAKADTVTDWAIDWVTGNHNKNFLLWIHYFDPHGPYDPPFPYSEMYLVDKYYNKGIEVPLLNTQRYGFGGIPRYQVKGNIRDINFYIAQYDGEISFVDSQIGRLRQILEKLRLFDRTVIIISSDHGESLGEHNYYFDHGGFLYDTLLKVPLVMRYTTIIPSNKIINEQVSLVDIMPTILDILRIKPGINCKIKGISLLPFILGKKGHITRYVFSEYSEGVSSKFAVRSDEWKLLYNKEVNNYELYNLKQDPKELINLCEKENEIADMLKIELQKYLKASSFCKEKRIGLDEETKKILRSLGYMQ